MITVLSLGAEGGSVRLLASQGPGDRRTYQLIVSDGTAALLNEEVQPSQASRRSTPVDDWSDALALLDREYPRWVRFVPLAVHPEFASRLRVAVEERCQGRRLDDWDSVLATG
jgi:hypothetical protein